MVRSPGSFIRLSRDEAWATVAAAHTGIFTSLRADGVPISLPVWFAALDARIYIGTPSRTKKLARIQHDQRVSFLVESGQNWAELRGVHLTGVARLVSDVALLERVQVALEDKYSRVPYRPGRDAGSKSELLRGADHHHRDRAGRPRPQLGQQPAEAAPAFALTQ